METVQLSSDQLALQEQLIALAERFQLTPQALDTEIRLDAPWLLTTALQPRPT